jgi:hypothetical protein
MSPISRRTKPADNASDPATNYLRTAGREEQRLSGLPAEIQLNQFADSLANNDEWMTQFLNGRR